MIKLFAAFFLLSLLFATGCVSRTVSSEPALSDLQKGKGYDANDRIVTKKIVWFWQEDFRNP